MATTNPEVDFWLDVQRVLQVEYAMEPEAARESIDGYRRRMIVHGALEAVYHDEPEDIAEAIRDGRFRLDPPGRGA